MSCFPGYLSLGGVELTNSARTTSYMRNGLAPPTMDVDECGCPDLSLALCDGDEYRLPALDDAPWFDPAHPESAEFAGLFVESIEGLDGSVYEREVFERIGDGVAFGRGRMRGREITVRGWLFGGDCCSIAYGLSWLAKALEGNLCKTGCRGDELWFFTCCPEICDETITGMVDTDDDGIVDTEMEDRSGADPDTDDGEPICGNFSPTAPNCCGQGDEDYESCAAQACVDPFLRNMQDVALVEGPRVIDRWAGGNCAKSCACAGCRGVRVEFTLVAGTPWRYGLIEKLSECEPWDLSDDGACVSPFVEVDADGNCPDPCAPAELCVVDPDCPIPEPPKLPLVANPCICIPIATARQCVAITPSDFGVWKEVVPYIEISSGSAPMRNVVVRFYQNGAGFDCADPERFPECGACATIAISYIPEGTTLKIDGTSRTATIECPGGETVNAIGNLYDADGSAFHWPVFDCAGVCACVDVDIEETASDACLSVGAAIREAA